MIELTYSIGIFACASLMAACWISFHDAYQALHPVKAGGPRHAKSPIHCSEQFKIITSDGVSLSGWYLPSEHRNGVVVLCHNHGGSKQKLVPYARFLHKAGYSAVLFDFRGHGQSGPCRLFTSLAKQWETDLAAVLRYIRFRDPDTCRNIGLIGFSSIGNHAALCVAGNDAGVKAIVLDCGPSMNSHTLFTLLFRRIRKRPRFPFEFFFVRWATCMVGGKRSILKAMRMLEKKAVFLIHAEKDTFILPQETRATFEQLRAKEKHYWLVPGAYHLTNYATAGAEYENRVLAYLHRTLD